MVSGWIILDKPQGLGSTQGVAAVKRVLRQAGHGKVKVGHGGTLDPLATGVLPIALGEATKLAGRMLDASKRYDFTIRFGEETDTLDAQGQVVETSAVRPSPADVEAVLARFTGAIEQVPPAFSALKIGGKRAYDLARAGETVELEPRQVTVYHLSPLPFRGGAGGGACQSGRHRQADKSHPNPVSGRPVPRTGLELPGAVQPETPEGEGLESVTLTAHVSKGTYIRSLARDIARALGTVGHIAMLRRTKAGPFTLEQAISLDKLEEIAKGAPLEPYLLPLEAGLDDIPALDLSPEQAGAVCQGRVLTGMPQTDGLYWARCGPTPVALMELVSGNARVLRGFNLQDVAE